MYLSQTFKTAGLYFKTLDNNDHWDRDWCPLAGATVTDLTGGLQRELRLGERLVVGDHWYCTLTGVSLLWYIWLSHCLVTLVLPTQQCAAICLISAHAQWIHWHWLTQFWTGRIQSFLLLLCAIVYGQWITRFESFFENLDSIFRNCLYRIHFQWRFEDTASYFSLWNSCIFFFLSHPSMSMYFIDIDFYRALFSLLRYITKKYP